MVGAAGPAAVGARLPASLLVLLDTGLQAGQLRLPSAVTLSRGEHERFRMPAERLARRLGVDLRVGLIEDPRDDDGTWHVVALDRRARDRAIDLAPAIEHLVMPAGPEVAVWLRPGGLLDVARHTRRALESVPLVSKRTCSAGETTRPWRNRCSGTRSWPWWQAHRAF